MRRFDLAARIYAGANGKPYSSVALGRYSPSSLTTPAEAISTTS
ncbi:hypothetical protein ACI2LF_23820 [Kribbella sp. NPDC020789]